MSSQFRGQFTIVKLILVGSQGQIANFSRLLSITEGKGTETTPQGHQTNDHAKVAHAVHNKCFVRSGGRTFPFDVEADQKVRADPDQFPKDKHHGNIASQDKPQHAETKQREGLKKAAVPAGTR